MAGLDSLLLGCGGSLLGDGHKVPMQTDRRALVIGIGGRGLEALQRLKAQVYEKIQPDDPGEAEPRYRQLRFLGIDSDDAAFRMQRGPGRLAACEQFSLADPNLRNVLMYPRLITEDPRMNWMEIDRIQRMFSPCGAGGVRQVGRYLLINRAQVLFGRLRQLLSEVTAGGGAAHMDVYLLAGLGGGTGSGCFVDVCYLLRKALAEVGVETGSITALLFLPDVLLARQAAPVRPDVAARLNANGFAALKELDYLMDLPRANGRFRQNYGGIQVDTQRPPVDNCYLISTRRPDGVPEPGDYGIPMAVDCLLHALLGQPGHLTGRSVPGYRLLGAASGEVPLGHFAAYLASGLLEKFRETMRGERAGEAEGPAFCEALGLTAEGVYQRMRLAAPELELTPLTYQELREAGPVSPGSLPAPWGQEGRCWLEECGKQRELLSMRLLEAPAEYLYEGMPDDSLIGRVFRELYHISLDPQRGPDYAAALLKAATDCVDREQRKAGEQRLRVQANRNAEEDVLAALGNTLAAGTTLRNRLCRQYRGKVETLLWWNNVEWALADTARSLEQLRQQLEALYRDYFAPLCRLLDRLEETGAENACYLRDTPEARAAYGRQIVSLPEVRALLDRDLESLEQPLYTSVFLEQLLKCPGLWLTGEEERIARHIRGYLERVFAAALSRTPQDYLMATFPALRNDPERLSQCLRGRSCPGPPWNPSPGSGGTRRRPGTKGRNGWKLPSRPRIPPPLPRRSAGQRRPDGDMSVPAGSGTVFLFSRSAAACPCPRIWPCGG